MPKPSQRSHDHRLCVDGALSHAASVCAARGARLTALRRRVLELVWASHRPVGAYVVLEVVARERGGAAPPTVYRALDFLLAYGLIHRIESMNAFVGCSRPGASHAGQFLICSDCGTAAELAEDRIAAAVVAEAARIGFAVERQTVEVQGTCPDCRKSRGIGDGQ